MSAKLSMKKSFITSGPAVLLQLLCSCSAPFTCANGRFSHGTAQNALDFLLWPDLTVLDMTKKLLVLGLTPIMFICFQVP